MLKSQYYWEEPIKILKDRTKETLGKDISPFLAKVMVGLGYEEAALNNILSPVELLHDPFEFYDMQKAVNRIKAAVENGENILIYGDYDADGITSASILKEALETLGAEPSVYLPDRFIDGYGPNIEVYKYYIQKGINLILTCDNGVRGHDAILYAQNAGVDVIVSDHHELADTLPAAYAIIHPRHPEGHYPFPDLCGAGVALKIAWALLDDLPEEMMDLAAIGTVADLVTLKDENRTLVKAGLKVLRQTGRIGLQYLYSHLDIDPSNIDEETIGFQIAPRLNALGRITNANIGVDCLTTFDEFLAKSTVEEMEKVNTERKQLVDRITEEARQLAKRKIAIRNTNILILTKQNWHEGVLGIVASHIKDEFQKPTIILCHYPEKGIYKGSARSVAGIDIYQLLSNQETYLKYFGGHDMAAGLTIDSDNFLAWQENMEKDCKDLFLTAKKESKQIAADLNYNDISLKNLAELDKLGPFGPGYERPIFRMCLTNGFTPTIIGQKKDTLKITADVDEHHIQFIGFKMGKYIYQLNPRKKIEVLFTLKRNEWQGKVSVQAILIDLKQEAPAVFDFRHVKDPNIIFSLENTLYLFWDPNFMKNYQNRLTYNSHSMLVNAFINNPKIEMDNLFLFDCPNNLNDTILAIQQSGVPNLYLYGYSPKQAFMTGMPKQQDFALTYQYLSSFTQPIPIEGNYPQLAQALNIDVRKCQLIIAVLNEFNLLKRTDRGWQINRVEKAVDIKQSKILRQYKNLSLSEEFFLYTDIVNIEKFIYEKEY